MSIDIPSLTAQAARHWKTWLPNKVADLKANGELEQALHGAAVLAHRQAQHLMQKLHYQEHEALEVVLSQFILLTPEPPDENDELEMEIAAREAAFQAHCREIEAMEAKWRAEDEEAEVAEAYQIQQETMQMHREMGWRFGRKPIA